MGASTRPLVIASFAALGNILGGHGKEELGILIIAIGGGGIVKKEIDSTLGSAFIDNEGGGNEISEDKNGLGRVASFQGKIRRIPSYVFFIIQKEGLEILILRPGMKKGKVSLSALGLDDVPPVNEDYERIDDEDWDGAYTKAIERKEHRTSEIHYPEPFDVLHHERNGYDNAGKRAKNFQLDG
jgi:hypothetical protein